MDYARLQELYGGQFIACRGDAVVASAPSHGELVRKLEEKGVAFTEVAFEFIRKKDQLYAF